MAKNIYKDINLDFDRHPLTGDIIAATDTEAIKKALRNLISLNLYEVPFDPDKGTNIRGMLFENFSPITSEFIRTKIREMVDNKEPRVSVEQIDVYQKDDQNGLEVKITYSINALNRLEEITLFVERTR